MKYLKAFIIIFFEIKDWNYKSHLTLLGWKPLNKRPYGDFGGCKTNNNIILIQDKIVFN